MVACQEQTMGKILIIDDEYSILETLEMFLAEKGHEIYTASTGAQGMMLFEREKPDVVILDIRLPDESGLDLLAKIRGSTPDARVIIITAFHDMETTVEAMKRGGYEYIPKPLDADAIENAVNHALQIKEIDSEPSLWGESRVLFPEREVIIGKSEAMQGIFKTIGLVCQNQVTILIEGETGTGKELIARIIHLNSLQDPDTFVVMDCSSVVETLLESEFFGHEKGSFTGATQTKQGLIELAGGGTLFLDEIGELPLSLQGKLLGFLQRREFMRVGGQKTLKSRCRVIAATNRDLANMVQKGRFREDLYYRLRVVTIHVPPLNARLSDIPELANHFLWKINRELGTRVTKMERGVMEHLKHCAWTGNVRELENVLLEAVVHARGNVILLEEIVRILSDRYQSSADGDQKESLLHMEKEHICNILSHVGWNRTKAAHLLGISLPTLRSKIRKYEILPSGWQDE
jgi:two-component system response regulator AtoC